MSQKTNINYAGQRAKRRTINGSKHGNWRGGRHVSSHGYIKICLGVGHPQADSKGYQYEHRLVAERLLGRPLRRDEIVHHRNGIKTDNRPENLEVLNGNTEHCLEHRKRQDLRLPGEENPILFCQCGCGCTFTKYDSSGRPRRFVSGHNLHVA